MQVPRKNILAALGLVNREPMHGYKLTQMIGQFGLEHWANISQSSIYNALGKLAKGGAVRVAGSLSGLAGGLGRLLRRRGSVRRHRSRLRLREHLGTRCIGTTRSSTILRRWTQRGHALPQPVTRSRSPAASRLQGWRYALIRF